MGGKTRPPYPAEFRRQIVELYASGRTTTELFKEFGCSGQTVLNWARRAGKLAALPDKGTALMRAHKQSREVAQSQALSASERGELEHLRKEVRRIQTERDILAKATAWFAGESGHGSKGSTR